MRLVIQRVSEASVSIDSKIYNSINKGLVVLIGISATDNSDDVDWLVKKLINLRIFPDSNDKMNLSIEEINGELLVISQFTLFASTVKGNRPSFIQSAKPEIAIPLYEEFIEKLKSQSNLIIKTGKFQSDMKVQLINDGPVTIIIDSTLRE